MTEPFFKIRPTKRSNPEARTTLDTLHQVQINRLLEKKQSIDQLEEQVSTIQDELESCENIIERNLKENQLKELVKEISSIKNEQDIFNYFLETGDILYQYYDIQEKIQSGVENLGGPRAVSKPGSVLAALQEAAKKDGTEDTGEQEAKEKTFSETNFWTNISKKSIPATHGIAHMKLRMDLVSVMNVVLR